MSTGRAVAVLCSSCILELDLGPTERLCLDLVTQNCCNDNHMQQSSDQRSAHGPIRMARRHVQQAVLMILLSSDTSSMHSKQPLYKFH
jgi:hypothetical protein